MAELQSSWAYPDDWEGSRLADDVDTSELVNPEHLSTDELAALQAKYAVSGIVPSWGGQYPSKVAPARMEGFRLWTPEGQEVLDFHQDILSMSLAWAHPGIEAAVQAARQKYPGVTMIDTTRYSEPALLLARDMVEAMRPYGDFRALFASTGTSANNQAIRLAMGALGGEDKTILIVLEGGYGGADLEMNAKCEVPGWRGLTSLKQNALVLKRDGSNLQAIKAAIKATGRKPIFHGEDGQQGVGGFHVVEAQVMKDVVELVHEEGGLVILDNVQAFVRNGAGLIGADRWADKENPKHKVDIATFAKGLGNGRPVAVALVQEDVLEAVKASGQPGATFDTFSQPTDGMVAAREVWRRSNEGRLWQNVAAMGERFREQLTAIAGRHAVVEEVIGEGGLIGIRLDTAARVVAAFQNGPKNGVEFAKGGLGGTVLRLPLPFNATEALIDEGSNRIEDTLKAVQAAA
ncbi:hypothetical protein A3B60_03975 [Candidatus Peregrinibacteria bacterium RIFCSPLOWO2_01_FULL_39_12]|nr:MAG: hypothetical protein A3B60_03975 [Candidatus Peregrinibacteria bacterium RIFCSPLOWO2_01_FULL_39_12]